MDKVELLIGSWPVSLARSRGPEPGIERMPRALRMARITLLTSERRPRIVLSTSTAAAMAHGLARTSAFSPYRKWTAKRLRYM